MKSIKIGSTILEVATENYREVKLEKRPSKCDINSELMELASELAEKSMMDNHNLLLEDLCEGEEGYKEEYQDEFNSLYDKYYDRLKKLVSINSINWEIEEIGEDCNHLISQENGEFVRFSDGSLVIYGDTNELKEDLEIGDVIVPYNAEIHH